MEFEIDLTLSGKAEIEDQIALFADIQYAVEKIIKSKSYEIKKTISMSQTPVKTDE